MLSIVKLLTGKPKLDEKKQKAAGMAVTAIFLIAVALFCVILLEINPVLSGLLFLLIGAACVKIGLYKYYFCNSVIIHLCCIAIGINYGMKTGAMTETNVLLCEICGGVSFFGFAELITGVISSVFGKESSTESFASLLMVCTPLFFTMYVFLPSETYFTNYKQLDYSYRNFILYFAVKTIAYSLVASLVICSFGRKFSSIASKLITGLLLCVYAQYMFMNKSLPTVIEEKADWDAMQGKAAVNAVVWVLLFVLPLAVYLILSRVKSLKDNKTAEGLNRYVSLFLGGIQLVTLVTMIFGNMPALSAINQKKLSGDEQFVVSKNKNIITIILDHADQHFFEDAYEQSPEMFECLKDFTYYNNTAMVYDSTNLSIPQLLTAAKTFPDYSIDEWCREITTAEPAKEFYSRLHKSGYTVNVFGNFVNDYRWFDGLFDNLTQVTSSDITINKKALYSDIDTMASYRYSPLILKRFVEPSSFGNGAVRRKNQCIFDNIPFTENAELELSSTENNYFIVQHVTGTHGFTASYEQETIDCLALLDKYFSELKKLGVYDSATIIVTADHGEHYAYDDMPIFYMKKADETSDGIRFSNAPVSHTDYAATCLEAAGLYGDSDEELFGRPVTRIGENEQRERLVFQRDQFKYAGSISWKTMSDEYHRGALLGYYYTGTKEDLMEHELKDPPDVVIETEGYL